MGEGQAGEFSALGCSVFKFPHGAGGHHVGALWRRRREKAFVARVSRASGNERGWGQLEAGRRLKTRHSLWELLH